MMGHLFNPGEEKVISSIPENVCVTVTVANSLLAVG